MFIVICLSSSQALLQPPNKTTWCNHPPSPPTLTLATRVTPSGARRARVKTRTKTKSWPRLTLGLPPSLGKVNKPWCVGKLFLNDSQAQCVPLTLKPVPCTHVWSLRETGPILWPLSPCIAPAWLVVECWRCVATSINCETLHGVDGKRETLQTLAWMKWACSQMWELVVSFNWGQSHVWIEMLLLATDTTLSHHDGRQSFWEDEKKLQWRTEPF